MSMEIRRDETPPTLASAPSFEKAPVIPPPPSQEAKEKRMEVISELKSLDQLDHQFFQAIKKPGMENFEHVIGTIDAIETLRYGNELSRETLGDKEAGINSITRRKYEGQPPRTAYVKNQGGESYYEYSEWQEAWVQKYKSWDEDTKKMEIVESPIGDNPDEVNLINVLTSQEKKFRLDIANFYGVPADELPITEGRFSPRIGNEAGTSYLREWGGSRVNDLFDFDVVPKTIIRPDTKDGIETGELSSVQEAAVTGDPRIGMKEMDIMDYGELLAQGPNHPGAKSFMRIACLDALVRELDGHNGNTLYDPVNKKFKRIDQGCAFGMSATEDLVMTNGENLQYNRVRSLPIETIRDWRKSKHAELGGKEIPPNQDWKLDDEARESCKRVYSSILEYVKGRSEGKPSMPNEGLEAKFLTSLFRKIYKNDKIAGYELDRFAQTLKTIIETGRPPEDLKILPLAEQVFVPRG